MVTKVRRVQTSTPVGKTQISKRLAAQRDVQIIVSVGPIQFEKSTHTLNGWGLTSLHTAIKIVGANDGV